MNIYMQTILLFLLCGSSCIANPRTIEADELKKLLDTDKSNVLVINALSEESFNDCHIAGSMSASITRLGYQSRVWPMSQKIVVYCASPACHAAETAYYILSQIGFTNLLLYRGGMREWRAKGYPVEGACLVVY